MTATPAAKSTAKRPVRTVSVVTVTLNVRDTLRLTMESVARQSFPNMEHIIIDGGSKDGTQAIAQEYKLGYFLSEKDKGVYDAMDKGAKAVKGDIVIFLNAGDTFYDNETAMDVAQFFERSDADIVFGNIMPVYLQRGDTHDHGAFAAGQLLDLSYVKDRRQLHDESIHHQATFYRRQIFEKSTYAAAEPVATGEYNLLLNAAVRNGARIRYLPRPVSRFVLGGISTKDFGAEWGRYVKARDALQRLYFSDPATARSFRSGEFHEGPGMLQNQTTPAASQPSRRHGLKMAIRRRLPFRIYDRLLRSLTERVSNRVVPQFMDMTELQTQRLFNDLHYLIKSGQHGGKGGSPSADTARLQKSLDTLLANQRNLESQLHEIQKQLETASTNQAASALAPGAQIDSVSATVPHPTIGDQTLINQARQLNASPARKDFDSAGYQIYSQWDEDGLLQYLIEHCEIPDKTFVEFGVGDYREANTPLLLFKDSWEGLVIDSSPEFVQSIKSADWFWRYPLQATTALVTAENVNQLINDAGISGDIGLLSIDVDGVDYWLWQAIHTINPRIVIVEYNGVFGPDAQVTVPYSASFDRTQEHYSWLYAGASLEALATLGERKGYRLVGANSGGNNAFFVRNDVFEASDIVPASSRFTLPKFREARDEDGQLSYQTMAQGRELVAHLPVVDIRTGKTITIADLSL